MQSETREPLSILREVFGHAEFRGLQGEVVSHVTNGGDAVVLFPTGAGKSICYQAPALCRPGVAIVVSPLIALMRGRGDVQMFRLEMPSMEVTKDIATDAKIRVDMQRAFFNSMVEHDAKVADWREAFMYGQAKATGNPQFLKLIATVVEKQEERNRLRRSRSA